MQMHLYKVSGYEEAIMSLRMSKGKFYSQTKAKEVQDLVYVCTNHFGGIADKETYLSHLLAIGQAVTDGTQGGIVPYKTMGKITGDYEKDIEEFKRLLGLTMNAAMGEFSHHTLMKYIDISFFTEGLHRGAQDDLDAHAIAFNNRITRFSTRLAEIDETKLSEWYQDKIIPFHEAHSIILAQGMQQSPQNTDSVELANMIYENEEGIFQEGTGMPKEIVIQDADKEHVFKYTAFGYVLERYADMSHKSGLYKDVVRGGMPLGMESNGLWKTDLFNLRYVYHMRSKLTKANPELKDAMELLADQIEEFIPVFGPYFRKVFTDSRQWEHTNKTRTVTKEEFELLQRIKDSGIEI